MWQLIVYSKNIYIRIVQSSRISFWIHSWWNIIEQRSAVSNTNRDWHPRFLPDKSQWGMYPAPSDGSGTASEYDRLIPDGIQFKINSQNSRNKFVFFFGSRTSLHASPRFRGNTSMLRVVFRGPCFTTPLILGNTSMLEYSFVAHASPLHSFLATLACSSTLSLPMLHHSTHSWQH